MTPQLPRPLALALLAPAAALLLAACGGGQEEEGAGTTGAVAAQGPADAQTATVVGTPELTFEPDEITMVPGTLELTMEIEGGVPHDLEFTGAGAAAGEKIETTTEGDTGTFVFDEAGTYDFVCTLHPGMDGRVVVG